jgi:hypothetical protein
MSMETAKGYVRAGARAKQGLCTVGLAVCAAIGPPAAWAQPSPPSGTPPGTSAPAQGPSGPARRPFALPRWLQVHVEQRTRFESIDHRYRPAEVGGDDLFSFRSRLQVRVGTDRWWAYSETQDSRVAGDDSASSINFTYENETQVQQLHAGVAWKDLGRHQLAFQVEGGRFSRDFGFRRLIARNLYRNTTNAYDGVQARLGAKTWSLIGLATRPVYWTYPEIERDPRLADVRFGGLYFTTTKKRELNADVYALMWRDGDARPARDRRRLDTPGGRLFGQFGKDHRAEYELEAAIQWGEVGGRDHHAWFEHAQVGYNWPDAFWKPRVLALWDYATGDEDPTDDRDGTWDVLMGARRFEFGPVNLYGFVARSNVNSPAVWFLFRPAAAWDWSLQIRDIRLAEARDSWRSMGLQDPTGQAGTHVGTQAELRLRRRFGPHVEIDSGFVYFDEGRFVRTLKPSGDGRALFAYSGIEVKF